MSSSALKREVARMHGKWAVWEHLWLLYWRLPAAWARAHNGVIDEYYSQLLTEQTLFDSEEEQDFPDLERMVGRDQVMATARSDGYTIGETIKIANIRLGKFPELVTNLRKKYGGDHRRLTKDLRQVYQFSACSDVLEDDKKRRSESLNFARYVETPGREDKRNLLRFMKEHDDKILASQLLKHDLCSISYPEKIKKEAMKTLNTLFKIEITTMWNPLTPEYIEKLENELEEIKTAHQHLVEEKSG